MPGGEGPFPPLRKLRSSRIFELSIPKFFWEDKNYFVVHNFKIFEVGQLHLKKSTFENFEIGKKSKKWNFKGPGAKLCSPWLCTPFKNYLCAAQVYICVIFGHDTMFQHLLISQNLASKVQKAEKCTFWLCLQRCERKLGFAKSMCAPEKIFMPKQHMYVH